MGSKSHTHKKKSPATNVETHGALEPHRFTVQPQLDVPESLEAEGMVDWQTELSKAQRFGHNLSQVPVDANPPIQRQVPISQRKLNPLLQRSIVDDEQKEDEEASRMQRKKK